MSLMLFPTEDWVMFTWSRSLPFMIPSTLIREQQTHRHLAKSQPLYQSSSDESWTLITVSSAKSKSSASVPGCRQRMVEQRSLRDSTIWSPLIGKGRVKDPRVHWYAEAEAFTSLDGLKRPLSETLVSFTVCCWFSHTGRILTLPWRSLGLHSTWVQQTMG